MHTSYFAKVAFLASSDRGIQRSLYFKTTHETKKLWSYVAGGLKIKVIKHRKFALWDHIKWSYKQGWS